MDFRGNENGDFEKEIVKKIKQKCKSWEEFVKEFLEDDLRPVPIYPFKSLCQYPVQQNAELSNIVNDLNSKMVSKQLVMYQIRYFDIADHKYIWKHFWSKNKKNYTRGGNTVPFRQSMHQYIVGWDGSKNMQVHHGNDDSCIDALLNLFLVSETEHTKYTKKISKIKKWVKNSLSEYNKSKYYDKATGKTESPYKNEDINKRVKWFTTAILNKEVMGSLGKEIEEPDREKLRTDKDYNSKYFENKNKLYSGKLDSLVEKIENGLFTYKIKAVDFHTNSLLDYSSTYVYIEKLEIENIEQNNEANDNE